ncbi:hypothetical protein Tco_1569391 [Tanacetum coccineum]
MVWFKECHIFVETFKWIISRKKFLVLLDLNQVVEKTVVIVDEQLLLHMLVDEQLVDHMLVAEQLVLHMFVAVEEVYRIVVVKEMLKTVDYTVTDDWCRVESFSVTCTLCYEVALQVVFRCVVILGVLQSGIRANIMDTPLSPDHVFDFFAAEPVHGLAEAPGNLNRWIEYDVPLGGEIDEPMVDPGFDEEEIDDDDDVWDEDDE